MKSSSTAVMPGLILIISGFLLLLYNYDLFFFDWSKIYPLIFILMGISLIMISLRNRNSTAVFWGTVFLLLGVLFTLYNYGFLGYYYWNELWPAFLIIFGVAFIMLFIFKPTDWGVLIPGGLFLFFGLVFLLRNLRLYYIQDIIRGYWPLILIVIGCGVIWESMRHKKQ